MLKDHLKYLDSLEWKERQEVLIRGVLAGNVFDWGAKEVVELMEAGLGFKEAAGKLESECTSSAYIYIFSLGFVSFFPPLFLLFFIIFVLIHFFLLLFLPFTKSFWQLDFIYS